MAWDEKRNSITVEEIQGLVGKLGIPHFQRGLVWGPDSVGALLESLFFNTPCGSFVFWKAPRDADHGTPLLDRGDEEISYFVVDGQQRIRSLHSVARDEPIWDVDATEDTCDPEQPEGSASKKVWCINLTRVPDLERLLKPHGKEYSTFLFAVDPSGADPRSPIRTNILPLRLFEKHATWQSLAEYHKVVVRKDARAASDADLADAYAKLRQRILDMRKREFFVSTVQTDKVAEVVALYNRVNSGGKRVETEERAFAKLVALQPSTWPSLAEIFATVHRYDDPASESREIERDDILRRGQERSYGFKLFIRVFLQVCHHHFGYSLGKSSFSFDIAKKESFLRRLHDLSDEDARWLWQETAKALTLVSQVLRDPLCCDDFRFLPDTQNLAPLFQLLISYPDLHEGKFRPLVAALCLRLYLAQIDAKTLARSIYDAADPDKDAFAVIPDLIKVADARIGKDLSRNIESASSIQDRYVLLLYWLVRHHGARDFSYENVPASRPRPSHGELPVEASVKPEKQHIVPFSRLARAMDDDDAQRGGTHPFNSIGNLTYISREMNSYETGLGDVMAPRTIEPERNLNAHLLQGLQSSTDLAKAYGCLRELLADGVAPPDPSKVEASYATFCALRRQQICEGFQNWLRELDRAACSAAGVEDVSHLADHSRARDRVEPQRPKFVDDRYLPASHLVRGLDLDNDVESTLIRLASRSRKAVSVKAGRLIIRLTKGRSITLEASSQDMVLRLDPRIPDEFRARFAQMLGLDSIEAPLLEADQVRTSAIEKLPVLADEVLRTEDAIRAAIEANKGKKLPGRDGRTKPRPETWTEARFLEAVAVTGAPPDRAQQIAEKLIQVGRGFCAKDDPFRSRSKDGSAIFNLGEIGLFTLYPDDVYIRVLRNLGRKGAPESDQEWAEVIQRLNACHFGEFTKEHLGHARIANKRMSTMTDEDLAQFQAFVEWFAAGVRSRIQGT